MSDQKVSTVVQFEAGCPRVLFNINPLCEVSEALRIHADLLAAKKSLQIPRIVAALSFSYQAVDVGDVNQKTLTAILKTLSHHYKPIT